MLDHSLALPVEPPADPARGSSAPRRKSRRRFFQFGLRSLFALTTLCALAAYQSHVWLEQIADQEEAINHLKSSACEFRLADAFGPSESAELYVGPPMWFRRLAGKMKFEMPYDAKLGGYTAGGTEREVYEDDLRCIAKLLSLRKISINDTVVHLEQPQPFRDDTLRFLQDLKYVKALTLESLHFTGQGLAYLQRIPTLRSLDVSAPAMSDENLACLKNFPSLTTLRVKGRNIRDAGLECIADIPRLEELELSDASISQAGLAHLGKCANLKTLTLDATLFEIADVRLYELASCPHVCTLTLEGDSICDGTIESLLGCSCLEELTIRSARITDSGLARLAKLPHLNSLALENMYGVAGVGFLNWQDSPLSSLWVRGCRFSEEGFCAACELQGVNHSWISVYVFKGDGWKHERKAKGISR